jgi:hypothetical protein
MKDKPKIQAVLEIEKGEQIVGAWITPQIPEIGFYKFLAKQKKDGTCDWVHFIQRINGEKDTFYRGEVASREELDDVVNTINKVLAKIFGSDCKLQYGNPEVYTLDGKNLGNKTVH